MEFTWGQIGKQRLSHSLEAKHNMSDAVGSKRLQFVYKEILFCYCNRECRLKKSWKIKTILIKKRLEIGKKVQMGKPRLLTKHNTSDAFCDRRWAMICSLVLSHTLVLINTDFWKPTNEDCYLGTLPALVVINWESSVDGRWEVENEQLSKAISLFPLILGKFPSKYWWEQAHFLVDVLTLFPESLSSTELS